MSHLHISATKAMEESIRKNDDIFHIIDQGKRGESSILVLKIKGTVPLNNRNIL